jgi:hypothetical protein
MRQEVNPRVAIAVIAVVVCLLVGVWVWRSGVHGVSTSESAPQSPSARGHEMAESMRERAMSRMSRQQNPAGAPAAPAGPP